MKLDSDSYAGGKSGRLPPDEAQRRLDEVRTRYGIHLANQQARPVADKPSRTPKDTAKQQLGAALCVRKPPLVPLDRMQRGAALKRGGARSRSTPPWDNHSFHFLIRIAECVSILHCEVAADSDAAARHQVEQIPNLIEWRAISFEELAGLRKQETTPQPKIEV
jgi:hypothetical protein